MTGPEGNSEFCFNVEGNIEIRGKQTSLFPKGPVIKWFVMQQKGVRWKTSNHFIGKRRLTFRP